MTAAEQLRRLRRFVDKEMRAFRRIQRAAARNNLTNTFVNIGFSVAAMRAVRTEMTRLARPTREKK